MVFGSQFYDAPLYLLSEILSSETIALLSHHEHYEPVDVSMVLMRAAKALTSLRIRAISSVSSLLAHTKPGRRLRTKQDAGQLLGHLTH